MLQGKLTSSSAPGSGSQWSKADGILIAVDLTEEDVGGSMVSDGRIPDVAFAHGGFIAGKDRKWQSCEVFRFSFQSSVRN